MTNPLQEISLCTMVFNQRLKVNSLFSASIQVYPRELITQYLMFQMDQKNQFPQHYQEIELQHKVIEMNVPGVWPGIWLFKLLTFLKACQTPLFAVWDEDDYFPPGYLLKAASPLIDNPSCQISWSYENLNITGRTIKRARYPSPWGTLVARTDTIRNLAFEFEKHYPRGLFKKRNGDYGGPLDMPFRKFIIESLGAGKAIEHSGERWYTLGNQSTTWLSGYRRKDDCIEGIYEGYPLEVKNESQT